MFPKYFAVVGASLLTVVSATIEQVQQPGGFSGQQVVGSTGGIYVPANIVEVGYAPQTLVAAQEYAQNKDKYAVEHANNAQGARAAESPLFRTVTLSETASDYESSESSEEEQDTSGLDTSAGSSAFGSVGCAAVLLALGSIASLY
ncbi:hypothetical protein EV183_003057 [Coemansia sp. RSA 2336]|nr:hypothetical protein EV183_003057 [Coemansia sp. RSA 2336]